MTDIIKRVSGREISAKDIEMIKWARKRYPGLSRSELAGTVCEILDWNTHAGHAKIQQCMMLLENLEADGHISLPPVKGKGRNGTIVRIPKHVFNEEKISGDLKDYEPIELSIAEPGDEMKRWRA